MKKRRSIRLILLVSLPMIFLTGTLISSELNSRRSVSALIYCEENGCGGGCGIYGGDKNICWTGDCGCGCESQWYDNGMNQEMTDRVNYFVDCPE